MITFPWQRDALGTTRFATELIGATGVVRTIEFIWAVSTVALMITLLEARNAAIRVQALELVRITGGSLSHAISRGEVKLLSCFTLAVLSPVGRDDDPHVIWTDTDPRHGVRTACVWLYDAKVGATAVVLGAGVYALLRGIVKDFEIHGTVQTRNYSSDISTSILVSWLNAQLRPVIPIYHIIL